MPDFVHLHVHSHYTLLESPITPKALLKNVAAKGMSMVALTDRGNLFGALEMQQVSGKPKGDVTPLIGAQVNIAPLGMRERTRDMLQLVLLAKSREGYKALTELVSLGWLDGFYYEPRIDLELLREKAVDLVCLTGAGQYGYLNYHLGSGAYEEALRQARLLHEIFGDDLYVELCDDGTEDAQSWLSGNKRLARELGLPLVATAWAHYLERDDADVHDVQLAVQKVTTLADRRRRRMPSSEFYVKTPEEMAALYPDCPEALSNTVTIAEQCQDASIETGVYHLPVFTCPESVDVRAYLDDLDQEEYHQRYEVDPKGDARGLSDEQIAAKQLEDAYLVELCEQGMHRRYGADGITDEHRERLGFEIQTITRMGFSAYFLIVQDFINWAKSQDIPVGPGRGSAAGSIVAYALGITDMCPLRYGLLFERFLNPGRKSMPDIDVDFCKDGRGRVIQYVTEKYGKEAVTLIMTLGTMKARMAIKDVARAYEWSPDESQDLANLVPEDPSGKHTIAVCLGKDTIKGKEDPAPKMQARYNADERTHQVLDTAMRIENLGRSLGVHACGVIIAPGPVYQYLPVCTVKGKPASQYNMAQVEDCGLLKMDFLGLKTMSI
ncbi:MAG: DNA polymerase III subunit alpha, partial [Planctomycetota bacterium]